MTFSFNARHGLVIVTAEVRGPSGNGVLRLALDTGATTSFLNSAPLAALGYDPTDPANKRVRITTGTGVGLVSRITLDEITALGKTRTSFPVLCHTLPPGTTVDGLLGVDFLRGLILTLDFVHGEITVV